MIEESFVKLGLNENEREVYLAVLKAGKTTHARISRTTGINRTTVYSIVNKLNKLGLVTEDLGEKIAYVVAEGPETIERMIEKEEKELGEKKKAAKELMQKLAVYRIGQNYSVPRIKFVEENDLSEHLGPYYNAELKDLRISEVLYDLLELANKYNIRFPNSFILLVDLLFPKKFN